ncbi:DUF3487 family protein [Vibrio sp. 10N.261.51.A1]|uniref:Conjugal transfer protein n=2 Tax=Vibrio cyclitrophicus TaxID=47951 RepID=A0A7Z1S225_9VIBR|nr:MULTISPECIES: DUF3487 family protein [Vibrio]PMK83196.1 hypothetical protein BCT92_11530 [Vibrio sp. 10N.261.52.E5]PMP17619.1 hypothetical protein BCS91_25785 [Vibrio cyclitrophicus]PMP26540.1 hypothetical protein BCS90_23415 [Vibrio cyclitrophicus]TKF84223.1 DUF3487 family protein [Vibrio sp. F13]
MHSASTLNVMPPFYKGLSMGEMGLLVLVCMTLTGLLGLALYAAFGAPLILFTALLLGALGAFALPKSLMRKLSRIKTHHCQHYASKRFERWFHPERYHVDARRFACKRLG